LDENIATVPADLLPPQKSCVRAVLLITLWPAATIADISALNKQFGTFTMISEATRTAAKEQSGDDIPLRELGRVAVVGRAEPVTVYEPLTRDQASARAADLDRFAEGLRAYYRGDFIEAARLFASLAEVDPPAAEYLEICRDHPPAVPEEWDGVRRMRTK